MPDDAGMDTVRIGASELEAAGETDVHFTGDGTAGGGGRFAGASTACVAERIVDGRLGGIRNSNCSSLNGVRHEYSMP